MWQNMGLSFCSMFIYFLMLLHSFTGVRGTQSTSNALCSLSLHSCFLYMISQSKPVKQFIISVWYSIILWISISSPCDNFIHVNSEGVRSQYALLPIVIIMIIVTHTFLPNYLTMYLYIYHNNYDSGQMARP